MRIHLRQAGLRNPSVVISDVEYFEILPNEVQYTQKEMDGSVGEVKGIMIDTDYNFVFDDNTYDFCEVYS